MSEERSKTEFIKENSRQLRGTIAEDLANDTPEFGEDNQQVIKHHGMYQQDDRDSRKAKNPDGTPKGKRHIVMVRCRIPGGDLTADQFLNILNLCDQYANGTIRLTSRQGIQFHYVEKRNVKAVLRSINESLLTTLAACGDVNRNVMCCPAPMKDEVHLAMQSLAKQLAEHFKPKTTGYREIWLTDDQGESHSAESFVPVEEPIYGKYYLPRKFKMAITLPEDNCVDIYANDLGFLVVVENDKIIGYNILVGGSMGRKPANKETFAAIAKRMCFITPEQVFPVAEAIVKVQRDFGNRADRQQARMKYLIHKWGLPAFKAKVEEYYGGPLADPHPTDVTGVDEHLGWHEQGDGKLFLGLNIEAGRVQDHGTVRSKSGLRAIVSKYKTPVRVTAIDGVLLCDIDPKDKADINAMVREYGMVEAEQLSPLRKLAIACVGLPTCGLSVSESERFLPDLLEKIEAELAVHGLENERFTIHMTGCPNGCARPYTPDLGIVGKAVNRYTLFVGGNTAGTRMNFMCRDMVPSEDIVPTLSPLFAFFKAERNDGESFGDFCFRQGLEAIQAVLPPVPAKKVGAAAAAEG